MTYKVILALGATLLLGISCGSDDSSSDSGAGGSGGSNNTVDASTVDGSTAGGHAGLPGSSGGGGRKY